MTRTQINAVIALGSVILGVIVGLLLHGSAAPASGGIYNQVQQNFDNGFRVGVNGTNQANQVVSSCSLKADSSIAATSTGYAFCTGVTGITSADIVDANFATSSTNLQDNWIITGAKASTTAGAIDFRIYNGTGRAQAPSASGTSGSTTILTAGH